MKNREIPIFFSTDDNYVPFLTVALHSLIDNSSTNYDYKAIVLNSGLREENVNILKAMETENFKIEFADVNEKTKEISNDLSLRLRDYYSNSIYYRLFIPSLFPNYEKALYLDADIVVIDDIAKLYFEDLGDNLVGAITDDVVNNNESFKKYSEVALGLEPNKYFNSGILVMNLNKFREENIEEKFVHLLSTYNFDTIAPDQDYLNYLCKGKVKYIHKGWDRMPIEDKNFKEEELHLVHYNMFHKPWHYDGVQYEKFFWKYAEKSSFYDEMIKMKNEYTEEQMTNDSLANEKLVQHSENIIGSQNTFNKVLGENYFDSIQV